MWDAARAPSGRVLTQPGRAPSRRCLTLLGRKRQLSCVQRQLQGRVLLSHKRLQVQGKGHDILPDLKQRHTGDFRRHTGVKTKNGQTHCYPWAAPGQALPCVLTPRLATPSNTRAVCSRADPSSSLGASVFLEHAQHTLSSNAVTDADVLWTPYSTCVNTSNNARRRKPGRHCPQAHGQQALPRSGPQPLPSGRFKQAKESLCFFFWGGKPFMIIN